MVANPEDRFSHDVAHMELDGAPDKEPEIWPHWMAVHVSLKNH